MLSGTSVMMLGERNPWNRTRARRAHTVPLSVAKPTSGRPGAEAVLVLVLHAWCTQSVAARSCLSKLAVLLLLLLLLGMWLTPTPTDCSYIYRASNG